MHKDCDKHYFKKPEFYRLTGENNYVRIDAEDKVTGHGQYVGDIMFPDMLTGKMVRSPYASARIISIDTSEAEKLPGVKCVLCAAPGLQDTPYGTCRNGASRRRGYLQERNLHHLDVHTDDLRRPVLVRSLLRCGREPGTRH